MTLDFRAGRWEDVLTDTLAVDLVCVDGPYSERVHNGHDSGAEMANAAGRWPRSNGRTDPRRRRSTLPYEYWTPADVDAFVDAWAHRCRGWMVCLSDSELCPAYRAAFERNGLTGFQPIPCVIPGMTVRLCGDGPSSWAIYANVGRPRALCRWGTLPGAYVGKPDIPGKLCTGGKPLWAMRALVRDYSRPGDLVCDPCAGAATTLLAAAIEGRRAIGAEQDPATWQRGADRLAAGFTPDLFTHISPDAVPATQIALDLVEYPP